MHLNIETPTMHAQLRGMVAGGKGYGISHRWDGTVLTVTSDSGSSSADLVGPEGPMGAKQVVVTFTEQGGEYIADKTFAEVKAAIDGGNTVVADWSNVKLRGAYTGGDDTLLEFTFHSFMGADTYLILQQDETVTYLVSTVGEEEIPSRVMVTKLGDTVRVTATYGWVDEVTTIALNEKGDPVSVTKNGETTTLVWEGFDEE